jgi:hypothetical protein
VREVIQDRAGKARRMNIGPGGPSLLDPGSNMHGIIWLDDMDSIVWSSRDAKQVDI